jgi:hypothetical protein
MEMLVNCQSLRELIEILGTLKVQPSAKAPMGGAAH